MTVGNSARRVPRLARAAPVALPGALPVYASPCGAAKDPPGSQSHHCRLTRSFARDVDWHEQHEGLTMERLTKRTVTKAFRAGCRSGRQTLAMFRPVHIASDGPRQPVAMADDSGGSCAAPQGRS